jgi:hypothetical protein
MDGAPPDPADAYGSDASSPRGRVMGAHGPVLIRPPGEQAFLAGR